MSAGAALLLAAVLLAGNAFFVGAEFALVSARRSVIEPMVEGGSRRAGTTLKAMERVSLMLAGAQLGITVCSLLLGSLSEPAIAHLIEPLFEAVHVPESFVHPIAFVLALALVTVLHVVIGEMVPFPDSFNNGTTTYYGEMIGVGPAGGVGSTYPGGTVVRASVQPGVMEGEDRDGILRFNSYFQIDLLDDPSALNGGKGVKRGDAFRWSRDARLLVAQDDAVRVGSVWAVRCLANE